MVVLAVGDVVGQGGRDFLKKHLRRIKRLKGVDFCVVNGENSGVSNGIDPECAEDIFEAGADVITTGNHVWQRREIYEYLDENPYIVRPANYPGECPGKGYVIVPWKHHKIMVANLLGTAFLEPMLSPFITIDRILKEIDAEIKIRIVDFHGEATSEKLAMGFYLDGRASALFGTHTHVQTADEMIYPGGLGYITDVGMTGPVLSVLGLEPAAVIKKFTTAMPQRFTTSKNEVQMCAMVFEIDEKTGKTVQVERIVIK